MSPARSDGSEESVVPIVDDEERLIRLIERATHDGRRGKGAHASRVRDRRPSAAYP